MPRDTEIIAEGIAFIELSEQLRVKPRILVNNKDVTMNLESFSMTRVATDTLSSASIILDNNKGWYNNEFSKGQDIDIYIDYNDAMTKQFHGKIDSIFRGLINGWFIRIEGRDRPELVDNHYIGSFEKEAIDNAMKAVIDNLNDKLGYNIISYSSSSIELSGASVTYSYRELNYLEVLRDLARRADMDFYIDNEGVFYAFREGSKAVSNEAVVSGQNVLSADYFGDIGTDEYNYIKVYGSEKEGCMMMWTEHNPDSISNTWKKEMIINDTSIETIEQLKDKANRELNYRHDPPESGNVTVLGMANLIPGYKIDTFINYIINDSLIIRNYTHNFSRLGFITNIQLQRRTRNESLMIIENRNDLDLQQSFQNPNAMLYSQHFTFDNNNEIASHSNTEIAEGKLRLKTEVADQGIALTKSFASPVNISQVELRHNGSDMDISIFEVSADNSNFINIIPGMKGETGIPVNITDQGKSISIRITFNSASANPQPYTESMVVLWK